ncbi:hypothetical protein COB11_05325 [Candidatus Aerophobetes bacterium]|uniref:Uncharacterized protein n=1 Tax=Aerophobetes bacterium TaxID=2030807 RepID=A0A2A4YF61_UNCAE|nr:MAG: hypothetical protein COB11_05325 [Candidatus Aerophobetes bacterium]
MIAADFDGTLVDPPKKGEPPQNQNIGNSAAGKDIIAYLKAGGILVVNSGNEISRVISRIKEHVPKEFRGNVLIAASGGNTLWGFDKDGNELEITAFRETALSIPTEEEHIFNCIYLGDDKRAKGNDRAGFEFADKDHSICVGTDLHLEPAAHEFLDEEHIIRGGPAASAHIFREVLKTAASTIK